MIELKHETRTKAAYNLLTKHDEVVFLTKKSWADEVVAYAADKDKQIVYTKKNGRWRLEEAK